MSELITRELLEQKFQNKMLNGEKIAVRHPVDVVDVAYDHSVTII